MKAFFLDQVPWDLNSYIISNNFDQIPMPTIYTSYQLLQARLVGMTYAEFLEFCRDYLGAQVIKRINMRYASVYFKNTPEVRKFVDILNQKFEDGYCAD